MSYYSVTKKIEALNLEFCRNIEKAVEIGSIELQDKSRSVQAKDAFWYAFEYARCNPDSNNIQLAWEQYKENRSNISDD
jgi:hypothetical protein